MKRAMPGRAGPGPRSRISPRPAVGSIIAVCQEQARVAGGSLSGRCRPLPLAASTTRGGGDEGGLDHDTLKSRFKVKFRRCD